MRECEESCVQADQVISSVIKDKKNSWSWSGLLGNRDISDEIRNLR